MLLKCIELHWNYEITVYIFFALIISKSSKYYENCIVHSISNN